MAAPAGDMEFSPVESFHLLYKNLWSMNIAYRIKLNVIDTILFRDGAPYYWIFTSEQTGEIMKKKAERLESNSDLIRALKQKSRRYTSSKEIAFKNKVAIVWYQETEKDMLSHICDETELKTILNTSIQEILCIQPYIGGISFRGSGLFEHRAWTQKDTTMKHVTYEMICERGIPDLYTSTEVEKWVVTEHQHGALTSLAKQLILHMGFLNKCKVSSLVIQCVFTDQWVPHIVACKRVVFTAVAGSGVRRDEVVYPGGVPPRAAVPNPHSALPKPIVYKKYTSTVTPTNANTLLNANTSTNPTTSTISNSVTANTNINNTNTNNTIPPPPSSPSSPSAKVRSNSMYDAQTAQYTHYTSENDRRAAALQRQSSIKAELYLADALEEARNIANTLVNSESAKFTRQGSTRTLSPPKPIRKSMISITGTSNGAGNGVGTTIGSSGVSGKHPTDTHDTIRNNNRFEESSTSTPVNITTSTVAQGNTTAVQSGVHSTSGVLNGTGSGKFVMKANTSQKVTQRATMFAIGRSASPTSGTRNSISGIGRSGSPSAGGGGTNIGASGASGAGAGFSIVINTNNNWNTAHPASPTPASPPSFKPPLLRAHTTQLTSTPTITPAFLHTNTSPIHNTHNTHTIDIHNMVIPAIDTSKEPSRVNYNTTDHYATVHMQGRPSTYNAQNVRTARHTINSGSMNRHNSIDSTMNSVTIIDRRASSATVSGMNKRMSQATINTTLNTNMNTTFNNTTNTTTSTHRVFRPDSANSVNKLRKTIDKVKCIAGASTGLLNTRRGSVENNINSTYSTAAVECMTEARHTNTTYYKSIEVHEDNNRKKLCSVFEGRRPISAPHAGRAKAFDVGRRPSVDDDDLHFTGGAPADQEALRHSHSRGNVVGKVVPFTGALCHGSYCNFKDRAKSAAQNDTELFPHTPSTTCPYSIAYKSILLCRAEVRVLGTELDENIQSLLDQIRLSSVSTEVLYTYFVRRHLNRVAQRCQDEAKRLQVANQRLDPAVQQITDIDTVYRGLVYAEALASIHPSRFYYTVPTCEMCQRIYTYLDSERETIVLNTNNAHTLHTTALHTAEMQIERRRFASFARNVGGLQQVPSLRQSGSGQLGGGRRKSERRRSSVMKVPKVAHLHNEIAPSDEDPYQADELVHSDQFVPHHTAQRDIYSDHHKKDNFATTLRTNVANIQFYADQAQASEVVVSNINNIHNVNNIDSGVIGNKNKQKQKSSSVSVTSPGRGSKVYSPTNSNKRHIIYNTDGESIIAHVQDSIVLSSVPNVTSTSTNNAYTVHNDNVVQNHTPYSNNTNPNTVHNNTHTNNYNTHTHNNTHTTHDISPPHSARRKALLYRDNIPINNTDININNTTHDSGIGSKGPVMKHSVNNITKSTATLSKWVNMLHSGTVHNLYTTTNPTTYEWDDVDIPYTKNTLSTDNRVKANKLRRPHSASAINTKRSNSSNNTDSTVYGIMQYPVDTNTNGNSNNSNSYNNINNTNTTTNNVHGVHYTAPTTTHIGVHTTHNNMLHSEHTPTHYTLPDSPYAHAHVEYASNMHSTGDNAHHTPHYTPHTTPHTDTTSTHNTPHTTSVQYTPHNTTHNTHNTVEESSAHVKFRSASPQHSSVDAPKRRPSSAGAVPYTTTHSTHRSGRLSREETIAVLENTQAVNMLHLAEHLALHNTGSGGGTGGGMASTEQTAFARSGPAAFSNTINSNNSPPRSTHSTMHSTYNTTNSSGGVYRNTEHHANAYNSAGDDFSAAYAYSSLPFMAAPYLPSRRSNAAAVEDTHYTQLQIDVSSGAIIHPTPTPAQIRQQQEEQERLALQRRIQAEREQQQRQRQQEYEQLQRDRQELQHAQRERANSVFTVNSTNNGTTSGGVSGTSTTHAFPTVHPRVSFMATSANNSIFSTPVASPANRRRKRSVLIPGSGGTSSSGVGSANGVGSKGDGVSGKSDGDERVTPLAEHTISNTDTTHPADTISSTNIDNNTSSNTDLTSNTNNTIDNTNTTDINTSNTTHTISQETELSNLLQLQHALNTRHEQEMLLQRQYIPTTSSKGSGKSSRGGSGNKSSKTGGAGGSNGGSGVGNNGGGAGNSGGGGDNSSEQLDVRVIEGVDSIINTSSSGNDGTANNTTNITTDNTASNTNTMHTTNTITIDTSTKTDTTSTKTDTTSTTNNATAHVNILHSLEMSPLSTPLFPHYRDAPVFSSADSLFTINTATHGNTNTTNNTTSNNIVDSTSNDVDTYTNTSNTSDYNTQYDNNIYSNNDSVQYHDNSYTAPFSTLETILSADMYEQEQDVELQLSSVLLPDEPEGPEPVPAETQQEESIVHILPLTPDNNSCVHIVPNGEFNTVNDTVHTLPTLHTSLTPPLPSTLLIDTTTSLFLDLDSAYNSSYISPINTTHTNNHTPYTTRTTHTDVSTTSTEPTVRNTIEYIDTNFISPVMSVDNNVYGGSDSGSGRYSDSRVYSGDSRVYSASIDNIYSTSVDNTSDKLHTYSEKYTSSDKYNNVVYADTPVHTTQHSVYSAEDQIYSNDVYDTHNVHNNVYSSEYEVYVDTTTNDTNYIYTDVGSSGEGSAEVIRPDTTNTGFYLATPNTESSENNIVSHVSTPHTPQTPVYIHDLHTVVSENTTNVVNTNTIDNSLLSPLELRLPTVMPHPHSPPSRAQERPFEFTGDSFRKDEEE